MKVVSRLALSALAFAAPARAATNIAIIDSGVDYKHKDLAAQMWHNPNPGEDKNGTKTDYAGDVNGWNFADKNADVIDYSFLGTFPQDDYDFFAAQSKILLGTATTADETFYKTKVADATFIANLEVFGNFVHGTHVSGISAGTNVDARIMPIKVIATKPPTSLLAHAREALGMPLDVTDPGDGNDFLIMYELDNAASTLSATLVDAGKYADSQGAQVANGSFGVSVAAEKPQIAKALQQLLGRAPTDAETEKWTEYLVNDVVKDLQAFIAAAPNTLFCFAAGNDGADNDALPSAPSNDKADNSIAVAATLDVVKLASFSNVGATMVEVAAPGVAINSTVPGDLHMQLSGTSMAAPFVTNVAGRVFGANPALKPVDVKKILMQTVDVKDFLKGKVSTSGIVNADRAVAAAAHSLKMPLDAAIAAAKGEVSDVEARSEMLAMPEMTSVQVLPLPNPLSL